MHELPGRMMKFSGVGAAVLVALAAGCGGDDASTGGTDAADDQEATTSPDASSRHDGSVADAQRDATRADASSSDATSGTDGSGDDATSPADAGSDSTTASDGRADAPSTSDTGVDAQSTPDTGADAPSASDAGADVVSSDAASDASPGTDASEAGACTVTTVTLLGGGGANDAGVSPKVLFSFDPGGGTLDGGLLAGWTSYGTGATPTLGTTSTDGHPCDGALTLTTAQAVFSGHYDAYYNYGGSGQDWTGYTKLHVWFKVVTTDYSTISGVEPRVDSGDYQDNLYGGFVSGATFTDGGWHETIVPLAPSASYVPAAVNGFQFELQLASLVDGGPSTPPQATLLVDSIWIE